jgi:hypothetical protein
MLYASAGNIVLNDAGECGRKPQWPIFINPATVNSLEWPSPENFYHSNLFLGRNSNTGPSEYEAGFVITLWLPLTEIEHGPLRSHTVILLSYRETYNWFILRFFYRLQLQTLGHIYIQLNEALGRWDASGRGLIQRQWIGVRPRETTKNVTQNYLCIVGDSVRRLLLVTATLTCSVAHNFQMVPHAHLRRWEIHIKF